MSPIRLRQRSRGLAALGVLWILVATAPVFAEVPELLSYQGVLMQDDGIVVEDGPWDLRFRLYPQELGGTHVFEQTLTVEVRDGLYNVVLSSQGGYDLAQVVEDHPNLFMEVAALAVPDPENGGQPTNVTLTPRQQLASVPYALSSSSTADTPTGGACYTRWGGTGCSQGFEAVVSGRLGGIENYSSNGGTTRASAVCVSSEAPVLNSFSNHYNRLMRGDAEGDGMDQIDNTCTVCCTGGCYTAIGTTSCKPGYTAVYSGRTGAIEAHASGRPDGSTLCVDGEAPSVLSSSSGYHTRLMRFRPQLDGGGRNGMDQVDNACVKCCKL